MGPTVTVIICTYNRAHLLPETLPTILNQNIPKSNYNVLVVNNNSNDSTGEILSVLSKTHKNLSVINESQQGLSYARNTGYKNSSSEWVIYLDDDALVPENFINNAIQTISDTKYDCFGGVYTPWYKYGKPKWFKDIYASTAEYYLKNNTHKLAYASGGIMAIKKTILERFGGFPTNMGMVGNTMAYGEETFLQNQMKKHGYTIGIIPEWSINHIVNQYKLKPLWYIKNGYVSGRDAWIIYEEHVTIKKILKYIINTIKVLLIKLVVTTPKLFSHKYYRQNWIIETFHPVSMQYGRVIGGLRLISAKR
jgi:glycosyltransferase involved in cell wall biosynthesis